MSRGSAPTHYGTISIISNRLTGVEMTDLIHYKVPGWLLGDLANSLFIRKQLEGIFSFRTEKVEALFGKWKGIKSPQVLKSV